MLRLLRTILILTICIVAAYYLLTYAVEEFRVSGGVSVKVEEPINILGQIDKAKTTEVIKSQIRGLESCWDAERKQADVFTGIIRVHLTVNNAGEVISPKCTLLAGESPGNRFQSCVCIRVNKWRFPPAKTPQGAGVLFQVYPAE